MGRSCAHWWGPHGQCTCPPQFHQSPFLPLSPLLLLQLLLINNTPPPLFPSCGGQPHVCSWEGAASLWRLLHLSPRVRKNPTFSSKCIGFLVLMQKNPIFTNEAVVLFQLPPYVMLAGTRHHYWWTLGPLKYEKLLGGGGINNNPPPRLLNCGGQPDVCM